MNVTWAEPRPDEKKPASAVLGVEHSGQRKPGSGVGKDAAHLKKRGWCVWNIREKAWWDDFEEIKGNLNTYAHKFWRYVSIYVQSHFWGSWAQTILKRKSTKLHPWTFHLHEIINSWFCSNIFFPHFQLLCGVSSQLSGHMFVLLFGTLHEILASMTLFKQVEAYMLC